MEIIFKVGEKIKEGWKLYKENLGNIILFLLIIIVINFVVNGSFFSTEKIDSIAYSLLFNLISSVISLFIGYLWIKSSLNMIDGKGFKPFSRETIPTLKQFWIYVKTVILYMLCMAPPFLIIMASIFFIAIFGKTIPIILSVILAFIFLYISIRLIPAPYLSIDKGYGARKNISEAWRITEGKTLTIFGKMFIIGLFGISGIILLFVGLIATYPIAMFLVVMLYREISKSNLVLKTEIEVEKVIGQDVSAEEVRQEEKVAEKKEI